MSVFGEDEVVGAFLKELNLAKCCHPAIAFGQIFIRSGNGHLSGLAVPRQLDRSAVLDGRDRCRVIRIGRQREAE